MKVCTVEDCQRSVHSYGLCKMHDHRMRRWGTLVPKRIQGDPVRRFWSKVSKTDGCWLWQASVDKWGYGWFKLAGKMRRAHSVSYELVVGPVPEGLQLDHLCRNPRCVNPAHLEPVTARENSLRSSSFVALNARKTHCPRGHPLSGENLYINPSSRGRVCKTCNGYRVTAASA